MIGMSLVDRLYVAWRVLRGHAVRVEARFFGAGDHEMTVTFYGGRLFASWRKESE